MTEFLVSLLDAVEEGAVEMTDFPPGSDTRIRGVVLVNIVRRYRVLDRLAREVCAQEAIAASREANPNLRSAIEQLRGALDA